MLIFTGKTTVEYANDVEEKGEKNPGISINQERKKNRSATAMVH